MKYLFLSFLIFIGNVQAETRKAYCPFVGNIQTGKVLKSSGHYKCFVNLAQAKKAGFTIEASPLPTATPAPNTSLDFEGNGPTSTESFSLTKSVTINYAETNNCAFFVNLNNPTTGKLVIGVGSLLSPGSSSTRIYNTGRFYFNIITGPDCPWSVSVR